MKRTLAFLLVLTQAPLAAAQLELAGVRRARQQITPYRASTVDVIANLTAQLPASTRLGDLLDIRYLRAVAAADLVLMDYLGHGPVEREAIAEAMGEHPEDLLELIHQELADVAAGPYLEECTDAMLQEKQEALGTWLQANPDKAEKVGDAVAKVEEKYGGEPPREKQCDALDELMVEVKKL